MKRSIVIIILFFYCNIASAQASGQPGGNVNVRICTPSRGSVLSPPLYIIFKEKKEVYRTSTGIPNIQPLDISSIEVLKGISATGKYGSAASNGVVEIYMKKGAKLDTNKTEIHIDTGKAIKYRQR